MTLGRDTMSQGLGGGLQEAIRQRREREEAQRRSAASRQSVLDAPVRRQGPVVTKSPVPRGEPFLPALQPYTLQNLKESMLATETGQDVTELQRADSPPRVEVKPEEGGGILDIPIIGDVLGGLGKAFDFLSTAGRTGLTFPLTAVLHEEQKEKPGLQITVPSWDRARDLAKIINWTGKTRGILLNDGNVIIAQYSDGSADVVHSETGVRKNITAEDIADTGQAKMQRIGPLSPLMGQLDVAGGGVQDILDALIIPGGFGVKDLTELPSRAMERYHGERGSLLGSELIDPLLAVTPPGIKTLTRPIRGARGARIPIPATGVPKPASEIWNSVDEATRAKIITPLEWRGKKAKAPSATVKTGWDDLPLVERDAIARAIDENPGGVYQQLQLPEGLAKLPAVAADGAVVADRVISTPVGQINIPSASWQFGKREIIIVEMPNGIRQPFYKRTGGGGIEAGAQPGDWVPFDGIQEWYAPNNILPNGQLWFDKTAYTRIPKSDPLFRWGTESMRDIGNAIKQQPPLVARQLTGHNSAMDINRWLGSSKATENLRQFKGYKSGDFERGLLEAQENSAALMAREFVEASEGEARRIQSMSRRGRMDNLFTGLPTFEAQKALPLTSDVFRRLGQTLSKNPVGRYLMMRINPDVAVNSTVGRISVAYNRDAVALEGVRELHRSIVTPLYDTKLFDINPTNLKVTNVRRRPKAPKREKYLGQILETPDDFILSKEQQRFVDAIHDSLDSWFAYAKRLGIDIEETLLANGQKYFPREMIGYGGQKLKASLVSGPQAGFGGKPAFLKKRYFEFFEEGVQSGRAYESNPLLLWDDYMSGMSRAIQEVRARPAIEDLGLLPKAILLQTPNGERLLTAASIAAREYAALRRADDVLKRAFRGESVPTQTINAITRALPDDLAARLGTQLDEALSYTTASWTVAFKKGGLASDLIKKLKVRPSEIKKAIRVHQNERLQKSSMKAHRSMPSRLTRVAYTRFKAEDLDSALRSFIKHQYIDAKLVKEFHIVLAKARTVKQKDAINALREQLTPVAQRKLSVGKQTGLIGRAAQNAAGTKKALSEEMKRIEAGKIRLGEVVATKDTMMRGFGKRMFSQEVAEDFNKYFTRNNYRIIGGLDKMSNIVRMARTGIDMGVLFIQMLPAAFMNPRGYAKATEMNIRTLTWDIQAGRRYMAKAENQNAAIEYIRNGGNLDISEYTRAAAPGGLPTRLTGLADSPNPLLRLPAKTFANTVGKAVGRFSASFNTGINVTKIELWKALRPMARTEAELAEVASMVTNMTGTMSLQRLGISANQRMFERVFMFFSPRFQRSMFAITGAAMQGGLRGEVARQSMVHLAIGASAFYATAAYALGQEPIFDPTDPRFFTLKIEGTNVGLASGMRSLLRAGVSTVQAGADDPASFVKFKDMNENPLFRIWWGRSAPATNFGMSVLTGRTFLGDPLEDAPDYGKLMLSEVLPFAVEGYVVTWGGEDREGWLTGVAETAGLSAYQETVYQRRNNLREKYILNPGISLMVGHTDANTRWEDLPDRDQRALEKEHPDLAEMTEESRNSGIERAQGERAVLSEYWEQRGTSADRRDEGINKLAKAVEGGQLSGIQFKNRVNELMQEHANYTERLEANPIYAGPLNEWRESISPADKPKEDRAVEEFFRLIYDPALEDPITGYRDWEEANRREEEFKKIYGNDAYNNVMTYLFESGDRPALWGALFIARKELQPYWELQDTIMKRYGMEDHYERIQLEGSKDPVLKRLLQNDAIYKQANKVLANRQKEWLAENPHQRQALYFFYGYGKPAGG